MDGVSGKKIFRVDGVESRSPGRFANRKGTRRKGRVSKLSVSRCPDSTGDSTGGGLHSGRVRVSHSAGRGAAGQRPAARPAKSGSIQGRRQATRRGFVLRARAVKDTVVPSPPAPETVT